MMNYHHFLVVFIQNLNSQRKYLDAIHPQWDDIGSETLYAKILCAHYPNQYAIIELIGEWNDCIQKMS